MLKRGKDRSLAGHNNAAVDACLSPDGQTLASGGEDQTIKLWDVETQQCHRTLLAYGWCNDAYSPDGLPSPVLP